MLRFAPSPTGDLHIGNMRAAIISYILSCKMDEKFIVRIEDTDVERNIKDKEKDILDLLERFEIPTNHYVLQSSNFDLHRALSQKLLDEGKAFYCYCTKEFLESKREEAAKEKRPFRYQDSWAEIEKDTNPNPVIRFKMTDSMSFVDEIKGKLFFDKKELESFVIMRNNLPTYNFACAIDDKDMTLIIRGEDHVSNTPKQIAIKNALGYKEAKYAHLPILLGEDGKKMSKRDKSSSVKWLLEQGLFAKSIALYLLMLGNSKLEKCILDNKAFNYKDLVAEVDISQFSNNSVHFDYKYLLFLNREILRSMSAGEILSLDEKLFHYGLPKNEALIDVFKLEVSTILELKELLDYALVPIESKLSKEYETEINILKDCLKDKSLFELDYEDFKKALMEKSGLKGKAFFKPLRIILSGKEHGIELDKIYPVIKDFLKGEK
ncbi:glutamate--tRNA ligase [Helicobacter sp. 13S00401-1]|uniref:glutamate--tRNA ligase n=1 Tax=Helicobacter sp. 13S00401-1 TaxID=1905758 RepID=UPI000BA7AB81|nr:glutamate--tRNA ligase [Helicobacter sp. 13S00401-1]PAF51722.1 glutamate--tRNA ligase [Helicobacter sp. 13S00401-1]